MKYTLGLAASLTAFWLVLSGHYTLLITSFGAASVVLVIWLARRMQIIDHEGPAAGFSLGLILYWGWLLGQIMRSALRVSWLILRKPEQLQAAMRATANTSQHELNQVIYANSITLTPGTLAAEVSEHEILIHSLEAASIETLDRGEMRQRVERLHH